MGVGGGRLRATGKCIYLMSVSEILIFDRYWTDVRFGLKKPVRNGSPVMMLGDNIYHRNETTGDWIQEDSHHSNPNGSTNITNLDRDTTSENVLVSSHFFYFGSAAPSVDLASINYTNGIGYSKKSFDDSEVTAFVRDIEKKTWRDRNVVIADPFDFGQAAKRVDQGTKRIS